MTSSSSKNNWAHSRAYRIRSILVRVLVFFCFASLGLRLVYVQAFLHSDLASRAERQVKPMLHTDALRYRILDRSAKVLAETVQVQSVFADPSLIQNKLRFSQELGAILGMDPRKISERIGDKKKSFVWIKRDVSALVVKQLKDKDISGIGIKQEWRRHYPLGPLSSHLLGLVGVDMKGLSGLEAQYEDVLNPQSFSKERPQGDIQLTVDADIQTIVEKELEWGVKKTGAKKGYALVQDPKTGEMLAMAAWPTLSLDPDHPPKPEALRIPEVVDVFEPGSTFKLVTAAAALQENLVSSSEIFTGENGQWKIKTLTIHDHEPHPRMTFEDVIVYSSNIGTAKIGERLGNDRLYQYARLFGFGSFPGAGLPGEAKGLVRSPRQWSGVSKYVVSFGQEVSVTALQLITAYSAIANAGLMMEPHVVKAILDDSGKSLWQSSPFQVRRVVSESTAARVTQLLRRVVERGTGQFAEASWRRDLQVVGKTGTAQKFDNARHRYDEQKTLVSFCGFFPASDPHYTVYVVLDEPEGRRWGGLDAAPVFGRIAEQIHPLSGKPNS